MNEVGQHLLVLSMAISFSPSPLPHFSSIVHIPEQWVSLFFLSQVSYFLETFLHGHEVVMPTLYERLRDIKEKFASIPFFNTHEVSDVCVFLVLMVERRGCWWFEWGSWWLSEETGKWVRRSIVEWESWWLNEEGDSWVKKLMVGWGGWESNEKTWVRRLILEWEDWWLCEDVDSWMRRLVVGWGGW